MFWGKKLQKKEQADAPVIDIQQSLVSQRLEQSTI
jgi:hypothetical protein